MFIYKDIIVTEEVFTHFFRCELSKCKGACCVEGDGGAPLEAGEAHYLKNNLKTIIPFVDKQGAEVLESGIAFTKIHDRTYETPLVNQNGACAYTFFESGIAFCGIERAYQAGLLVLQKPISCHLYPIRLEKSGNKTMVTYHRWSICGAACQIGYNEKIPLFRFLKPALIRYFGTEFYLFLEAVYNQYYLTENTPSY